MEDYQVWFIFAAAVAIARGHYRIKAALLRDRLLTNSAMVAEKQANDANILYVLLLVALVVDCLIYFF